MRIFHGLLFFLSLFFFILPTANAIETSQTPTKPIKRPLNDQVLLNKKTLEEQRNYKKASIEAKVSAVRTQRIRLFWTIMREKYLATISRLEKLIDRIETRVEKLDSNEFDVPKLQSELDRAKTLLAETNVMISELNNSFETSLTTDNVKNSFSDLKEKLSKVKSNLKEVHQILVHTIGDIKGLRVGNYKEATKEGKTQ